MKYIFKTPIDNNYFFGYYDKSPLNIDNKKLLACRVDFIDRMPTKYDTLEIGYFNWKDSNEFIKLSETKAWNWQQGCMLQWLAPSYDSKIIYNDRRSGKFISVILNIETKVEDILPMSFYTISSDGKFALCIDNERHYWHRKGYNYQGVENLDKKKGIDENDGIWYMDMVTKELSQIINMKKLLDHKPLSNMRDAIHYVEHLMISPNSKRFCFLHRWRLDDGGIYARFYTLNVDGSDLYLVNDSGRMSHACWRGNSQLLAFCGLETPVNKLRKYKSIIKYFIKPLLPIYHRLITDNSPSVRNRLIGDSYVLFNDKTSNKIRLAPNILSEDGHPSFRPGNLDVFITDTYPNQKSIAILLLFSLSNNKTIMIDSLNSIKGYDNTGYRCDLHPKWSFDGGYISIDTMNDKVRGIYLYEITRKIK
jgi:hypothetical protein